jgi:hypothetical protein
MLPMSGLSRLGANRHRRDRVRIHHREYNPFVFAMASANSRDMGRQKLLAKLSGRFAVATDASSSLSALSASIQTNRFRSPCRSAEIAIFCIFQ